MTSKLTPTLEKRIRRELDEIRSKSSQSSQQQQSNDTLDTPVTADTVNGNLYEWQGQVHGPKDSPYEKGIFHISIKIPNDYPYSPPVMKFETKVWHPNISSQTGMICLDILGKEWSPALSIRTALISIQALLASPEPDDPQDAEVAEMYKTNREKYNQTAKFWCESFAMTGSTGTKSSFSTEQESQISQIVEMGFPREKCIQALVTCTWNTERAMENLLTQGS